MDDKTLNKEYIFSLFTGMSETMQKAVVDIMLSSQVNNISNDKIHIGEYMLVVDTVRYHGYNEGYDKGFDIGFNLGYKVGYDHGYNEGYYEYPYR